MRSEPHTANPRGNPLIEAIVRAVSDIGTVFVLLGNVLLSGNCTAKKTDRSEPPDAAGVIQSAGLSTAFGKRRVPTAGACLQHVPLF